MTALVAWLAFPVVFGALCIGLGVLAERLARARLETALLAPLGLCVALAATMVLLEAGAAAAVVAVGLGTPALGGLVLAGRSLGRFTPGPGAAAAAAAYALYIAPVALTGSATFLGYNLLNDTAIHLALVDYLADHGAQLAALPSSSYAAAIDEYIGQDYPLGSHGLLAALRVVVPLDAAELYQPFLAASVALAAAAVFALVRAEGLRPWTAAGIALVAISGQLLFSFSLQGSIKELPLVAVLAAAAALGAVAIRAARAGPAVLLGLAGAAVYSIYGIYGMAWIAPLGVAVAVFLLRARAVKPVAAGAGAFALAVAPHVGPSIDYYAERAVLEAGTELGPLGGPLDPLQITGIWLNGDYRFPPDALYEVNIGLTLLALAAALLGLVWAVRRRSLGPLVFLAPSLVALAAGGMRGSPYVDAKLMAIVSPAVVLLACFGLGSLRRGARPALAVLVAAVLVSDALAYRVALPAPLDRLEELAEIGDRFGGRGPVLVNELEDYVMHFGREARLSNPYSRWTAAPIRLRNGLRPDRGDAYPLDELDPSYVDGYEAIVVRPSPEEARPPAHFARAYKGRWYEVWTRRAPRSGLTIPFLLPFSAAAVPRCAVVEDAARAGALAAALRPQSVVFDIAKHRPLPPGWYRSAQDDHQLETTKGGAVGATGSTGAGRYAIWVRGRLVRRTEVLVDGRRVGTAQALQRRGQWTHAGTIELEPGEHRVELRRPTRSLRPGDGAREFVGPVVAVRADPVRIARAPAAGARTLCGESLDWIEAG